MRLGRAGWGRGTRRKPVPGGSMAPSMAPTVLRSPLSPSLTVSRGRGRTARKRGQKQGFMASETARRCFGHCPGGCGPLVRTASALVFKEPTHRARGVMGRQGGPGGAGPSAAWARGMPRAGWAGRPTPVLPCAQDAHTSKPRPSLQGRTCGVSCTVRSPAAPPDTRQAQRFPQHTRPFSKNY